MNALPVFITGLPAVIISLPSLCGTPVISLPSLFITGLPAVIINLPSLRARGGHCIGALGRSLQSCIRRTATVGLQSCIRRTATNHTITHYAASRLICR